MKSVFKRKKKVEPKETGEESISTNLQKNLEKMKDTFEYPANIDFAIREIHIKALNAEGALLYVNGAADKVQVEKSIITPLIDDLFDSNGDQGLTGLMNKVIRSAQIKKATDFSEVIKDILSGNTILLVDGYREAVSISTSSFEARNVERPQVENVIKGPKEGFVESEERNRSMIRKYVQNEKLVAESITIGERSQYKVSIMYIKNLADPELIKNVKKRINEIQVDGIITISQLEQHIEERTYSLVPTVLNTERPDRAASFLQEGYIALVDSSPGCLVVPVTLWSFFHSAEDQYQRWPYANFIRIVRVLSYIIALFTPGVYVALTTYHIEMIPTDLMLSISATRELVPFPVFVEVLIMEIAFELIREAGARVPASLGPTISIVGALILGQAAVQAGIVSPILVIVVAITGLASYAIPEISTNYMIRIGRFLYLGIGAVMGFYGLSVFFIASVAYLVSIKSFDVPFMAPKAPHYPSSGDTFLRSPLWKQYVRPLFIHPQDAIRAKKPKGRSGK